MYKQLNAENKKIATLLMLAVFLLSFCLSIVFGGMIAAATVDASKADRLFTGENMKTSPTESGVSVSAKDGELDAIINYNAVLALNYTRKLTSYDESKDGAEQVTIGSPVAGQFSMQFSIANLFSDKIVFEFSDYTDEKKVIRIIIDFSEFIPAEDATDPNPFKITVFVEYTKDGWETTEDANNDSEIGQEDWDYSDNSGNFLEDSEAENNKKAFTPSILQDIVFEIKFDFSDNKIMLNRTHAIAPDEDSTDPTANYKKFSDFSLQLPKLFDDMKFNHDTAKMSVKYEKPNGASDEPTELVFRSINEQSLSNNSEVQNGLPIIMTDKKISKELTATAFGEGTYDGLKTSRKAGVTLPIVIADPINQSVYGYLEIWKLDSTGKATEDTPVDTKEFTWGSSGISYTFDTEGTYEVRIFAGSLLSVSAVKGAVKETDPDAENYQKVVAEKIHYRVISDKNIEAPKLGDVTELQDLINETFKTLWQDLPEYQKDFTFPRPDGLFSNGIDEDYTLSFSIGYKHETDNKYQWSDSLNVRITRTGLFKFKYVVKAPSGKKNTDDGEFFEEDYPEFELRFSDSIAPKIDVTTNQKNQEIYVGQNFKAPSPSVTDNSYDGGHIIQDETRVWYAYAGWKHANGLLKENALELDNLLEEVEFDDNGNLKMDKAGTYYFVVFYQAEDNHNNTTPNFPTTDAEKSNLSDKKWSTSFWLIKLTVKEPDTQGASKALLITLIVLGSLSLLGIVALLLIKPIDEANTSRKARA